MKPLWPFFPRRLLDMPSVKQTRQLLIDGCKVIIACTHPGHLQTKSAIKPNLAAGRRRETYSAVQREIPALRELQFLLL